MARPLHTIKRRRATIAWLLAGLLLVLPAGHHATAGILLCIGADGHVDVEDGRYGDCDGVPRSEQAAHDAHTPDLPAVRVAGLPDAGDDCGDCLDVALLVNPTENRVVTKTVTAPVLFAATALVPRVVSPRTPRAALPAPLPPAPPPGLGALSTVVLLV